MKKRKIVKMDDREITIKELTVQELMCVASKIGWIPSTPETKTEGTDDMSVVETICFFVSDVSVVEIKKLAPSELEVLYDAFSEVNQSSLSFAKYMGFDTAFDELRKSFLRDITSTYKPTFEDID